MMMMMMMSGFLNTTYLVRFGYIAFCLFGFLLGFPSPFLFGFSGFPPVFLSVPILVFTVFTFPLFTISIYLVFGFFDL